MKYLIFCYIYKIQVIIVGQELDRIMSYVFNVAANE